jgi:primase-polymerase (primpol)-like protein
VPPAQSKPPVVLVYPGPTPDNLAAIPQQLKAREQWVLWRGERRGDKVTKIPLNPRDLTPAKVDNPRTWTSYETAIAALDVALEEWKADPDQPYLGAGVGYVFTQDDPFFGADFDGCLDPTTGMIADWARVIVDQLRTYTEVSQGSTGLHAIGAGTLPPGRRRKGQIELYDSGRFFCMTGWRLDQFPATVEPRQLQVSNLWCTLFAPEVGQPVWTIDDHGVITNPQPLTIAAIESAPDGQLYARFVEDSTASGWPWAQCEPATPPLTAEAALLLADDDIVQRIKGASNAGKVLALALGNWEQDYGSQSEADLAFCVHLAFWSRDADQIDRLFRTSGLLRDKWDEKRGAQTYGERTIAEALASASPLEFLCNWASSGRLGL